MEEEGPDGGETSYYESLAGATDPARAAGWRRRIGQWARFEMALAPWTVGEYESLLDLGCGVGDLCAYLERTGREVAYTGIEARRAAIEEARRRHPGGRFIEGDLYEVGADLQSDLVVAVGSHIDGRAPDADEDRLRRLRRLVRRARALASVGCSWIVLEAGALGRRASLRAEPALFGATRRECEKLLGSEGLEPVFTEEALGTDLGVAARTRNGTGEETGPSPPDGEELLERVVRHHLEAGGRWTDVAWLWLESDRPDRARRALERVEHRGEEFALLVDRVELDR